METLPIRRENLLLGDLLATGLAADEGVEGDGVSLLAAILGDDAAGLLTLGDKLEALEGAAGPVEGTSGGLAGDLGLGATVLLVGELLAEATVADTGADVDAAQDSGATHEVPVGVLGSALATVAGLDEVSAVGDEELALLLEVLGHNLDPAERLDVLNGGTLALAGEGLLLSDSDHCYNQ
eukprot:159011_1